MGEEFDIVWGIVKTGMKRSVMFDGAVLEFDQPGLMVVWVHVGIVHYF
jgi:hypothetical protein